MNLVGPRTSHLQICTCCLSSRIADKSLLTTQVSMLKADAAIPQLVLCFGSKDGGGDIVKEVGSSYLFNLIMGIAIDIIAPDVR